MHLYFDESGDFAFPADRYDVYVQAGLIVPDSFVDKVEHYVTNTKERLGLVELHAAKVPDDELVGICEWLNSGPLSLVGQATDTAVMTTEQLGNYRQQQAARLAENLTQYKAAGGRWDGAEAWYTRHIKRAELSSRVSDSEYIQAHMFVGLIHAALFKSIVRYIDDEWRDDLVDFHLVLDAKLPGKLAAGEKDLDILLVPLLGSNDYELVVPNTWAEEPPHPFATKFFESDGKVSLNRIFEHGLRFESSREHAGLQLVDVVAYVTRRAILDPEDGVMHRAYGYLRENLRTERNGQALRLLAGEEPARDLDEYRYRLVL
jgi:hypothetical protein